MAFLLATVMSVLLVSCDTEEISEGSTDNSDMGTASVAPEQSEEKDEQSENDTVSDGITNKYSD